jgi:hypothetical protein
MMMMGTQFGLVGGVMLIPEIVNSWTWVKSTKYLL